MNGLTPELVERIYAEAPDALSNEEMYARVQEHTGMTNEQLQEMKTFGTGKTKTSAVKNKLRWFQQTLRQAGIIERVPGARAVWKYAKKTSSDLHEVRDDVRVVAFSTDLGVAIFGDARNVFSSIDEPITLCLTSPPYMLKNARDYGSPAKTETAYIDFMLRSLEPIVESLVRGGSVVINTSSDIFNPGRPSRSLYLERLTLALCDNFGLELMDRLIWVNRSKPPAPTHWACKEKVQLAVAWEPVLWFTNDAMHVKSDNRRVLQPHTDTHKRLIAAGGEDRITNYGDGAYQLKRGSYGASTDGSIMRNVIERGNACSDTRFCHRVANELGLPRHGATFPTALASTLIEFLTEKGDLVVDLFAGLCKVPVAAERLGRRWIASDKILEWFAVARHMFSSVPGFESHELLDNLVSEYQRKEQA